MVTSMLEKTIEIEGLLRIIRDGKPLPETYILLHKKVAELSEQAEGLGEPETEKTLEPVTPHADFVMATPEPAAQPTAEVIFTVASPSDSGSGMAQEDLSLIEEDDILLSFDETTEEAQSEPEEETTIDITPKPYEESFEADVTAEPDDPSTNEEHAEAEDTATDAQTIESKPDSRGIVEPQQRQVRKLRASFSLNDRFLFARELFNGNMKMFDSTLDFIEGIEDYSIIEDYFYSELEWNPEDTSVAAFMEILRPNFRE